MALETLAAIGAGLGVARQGIGLYRDVKFRNDKNYVPNAPSGMGAAAIQGHQRQAQSAEGVRAQMAIDANRINLETKGRLAVIRAQQGFDTSALRDRLLSSGMMTIHEAPLHNKVSPRPVVGMERTRRFLSRRPPPRSKMQRWDDLWTSP